MLVVTDGTRFLRISYPLAAGKPAPYNVGDVIPAGIAGAYASSQALMVNIDKSTFKEGQAGELPDLTPEKYTVPQIVDGKLLGRYVELSPVTIYQPAANRAKSPGSDAQLIMLTTEGKYLTNPVGDGLPGMKIIGFTMKWNKESTNLDIAVLSLAAATPDALYARCGDQAVEMTADGDTFTARATLAKGTALTFDNGASGADLITYGAAQAGALPLEEPAQLAVGSDAKFTVGEDGEYTLTVEFRDDATLFKAVKEVAGIENVAIDNAEGATYYRLDGIKLDARPARGLYIERTPAGARLRQLHCPR